MKKIFINLLYILMFVIILSGIALAADNELPEYPELKKIVDFINFIIDIIQWASASIAGLIATVTGWQILTAKDTKPLIIAKQNFSNAFWALFFIFGGTYIADFFVSKLYQLLAS